MSSDVDHVSGAEDAPGALSTGDDSSAHERRMPYHAPKLVVYGSVRDLTLGVGGTSADANNKTKKYVKSDPYVKQNVVRIGTHPLGIGLYLFEYKPGFRVDDHHRRHFGVMADEVEQVMPEAVSRDGAGIRQVDHALLGISDFAQQLED